MSKGKYSSVECKVECKGMVVLQVLRIEALDSEKPCDSTTGPHRSSP